MYYDSFDKPILIIEESTDDLEKQIDSKNVKIIKKEETQLEEFISNSDFILTIGNIDISEYNLEEKCIMNINNDKNHGQYTSFIHLEDKQLLIHMIKVLEYGLYYPGLITIDLDDIAESLNGTFAYEYLPEEELDELDKKMNSNSRKKVYIIFEVPENYYLDDMYHMVDKIRSRYKTEVFRFGLPVIPDIKEIKLNIFYEK